MRRIVVLLVVACLGGVAWFALAGRNVTEDDGAAIDRADDDEALDEVVTLRGRSEANPVEDAGGRIAETSAEETPDPEAGRFVVRGELVGLDEALPGMARVRAFPVVMGWVDRSVDPAVAVVERGGRFTLDVTALFSRMQGLTHLDVCADHPAYVQGRSRVDVTALKEAGRGEVSTKIALRPGLAITGEVVTEDGQPVVRADVALFRAGPEGPRVEHVVPVQPLTREETDEQGRFRLRVASTGTYLVVAVAAGLQPAGASVVFATGVETALAPLVLEPGVNLEGRVLYEGIPVADVWIEATERDGLSLGMEERIVGWHPGPVLRADGSTNSDERGRFRLAGLSPGRHVLVPYGADLPGFGGVCHRVVQEAAVVVEAPADDVVVEIAGAVLELRATCSGTPIPRAGLGITTAGSMMSGTTNEDGVLRLLLAPGREYTVRVEDDRYEEATLRVRVGTVGSEVVREIDLVVAAPKPSVLVTFEGPGAASLERAWFRLLDLSRAEPAPGGAHDVPALPPAPAPFDGHDVDDVAPGAPVPPPLPTSFDVHDVDAPVLGAPAQPPTPATFDVHDVDMVAPGVYRLKNLAPGHYELTAKPGCGFWEESGYFLEAHRGIEVPVAGEVDVRIPLVVGGRLRIAARDEAGALLGASCAIRNGSGEKQAVTFSTQADSLAMTGPDALTALSPATVGPPLLPGTYTIELSMEGYEPRTVTAAVKANETTEVDVTLAPR